MSKRRRYVLELSDYQAAAISASMEEHAQHLHWLAEEYESIASALERPAPAHLRGEDDDG